MIRHYRFVDYATQGYMALVGLLVLFFHNASVPEWTYLVAAHGAGMVLIHLLLGAAAKSPGLRWLDFLRHFYPVLLYTGFYRETGALNRMFVTDYMDPMIIRLEDRLFGLQPSVAFMEGLPYRALGELFYAAYFSYYVMIAGVGLALFCRQRKQFYHYVSVVSFVFYVCYTVYIFLPVMGPRVFFREIEGYRLPAELQALAEAPVFPAVIQSAVFFKLMAFIYHNFEAPGAAFPSSHVAIAITTLYFSHLYLPRIRRLHLTMVILLCLSTIYCRYHYAVDVVAGALTAALLVPVANWLYRRLSPRAADEGQPLG